MKKIVMFGVAALALTSCSQEELLTDRQANGADGLISFRARTGKTTRAQDLTSDNLTSFMVYGYKGTPEMDFDKYVEANGAGGEEPVEMTEYFGWEEFTKDDVTGYFNSEKDYYYPVDNSFLIFPCYAPASVKGVEALNTGGIKFNNFTVADNIEEQVDLVADIVNCMRWSDSAYGASVAFEHMLSKVYVAGAKNTNDSYNYQVAGVKFGNIHKSGNGRYMVSSEMPAEEEDKNPAYDYVNAGSYPVVWTFSDDEPVDELSVIFETPVTIKEEETDLMGGFDSTGSFMMIPQQLVHSVSEGTEEAESPTLEMKSGVAYIALLLRITDTEGNVVYPFDQGVDNISEIIGDGENASKFAWAVFPIASRWSASHITTYTIDFTHGAGYVAPGAEGYYDAFFEDEKIDLEYKPILGGKVYFIETESDVRNWDNTDIDWTNETNSQKYTVSVDVADEEDPFGGE